MVLYTYSFFELCSPCLTAAPWQAASWTL